MNVLNLLEEKKTIESKLENLLYGSIEIRNQNNKKIIYVHFREKGKQHSKYVGEYSKDLYNIILKNNEQACFYKNRLKEIRKELKKDKYSSYILEDDLALRSDLYSETSEKHTKKILVIATGGTISSLNKGNGLEPSFSGSNILKFCPEIKNMCEFEVNELFALDSTNIRLAHWIKMANVIEKNYEKYDGFIILHGTDTMAYSAAALNYLIQDSPKPIVFTGSQKPIDNPITDAIQNIYDAFAVACSDNCFGVQIVFFGSIIAGSRARKNFSKSYFAFGSINFPELGHVYDNKVTKYINDPKPEKVKFYDFLNPNVGLIKFIPGMKNDVLSYLIDQYDGLIVETFGVGGLPEYSDFYKQIARAISMGKMVVLTTQVPNEGSNLSVYKVGSYIKNNLSVLEAHDMTTESALCKLMWVLTQTSDAKEAEILFYKTIGYDILYK